MADRRTAVAALVAAPVLVVALLAGGCEDDDGGAAGSGGNPVEPADPPGEVAEPDASFTVEVSVSAGEVNITWALTNDGDQDLWVANRPPDQEGSAFTASPDNAYVVGQDADTVEIGQRVFARPDTDVTYESLPRVGVTRLRPGDRLSGEVAVERPFVRYHPYGDDLGDGTVALPDPAADVVFCLGVLPTPLGEQRMLVRADGETFTTHSDTTDQYLFCSDPADLSGG